MPTNQTNNLSATIVSTEDTTGNVPINRGLGNLAFDSNFADFFTYRTIQNPNQVLAATGTKCFQLYVRNLDPSLPCQVTWVPTGGSGQTSPVLYPGDVFIIWQQITNTAAGFTAPTVTCTAPVLVEYFVGG